MFHLSPWQARRTRFLPSELLEIRWLRRSGGTQKHWSYYSLGWNLPRAAHRPRDQPPDLRFPDADCVDWSSAGLAERGAISEGIARRETGSGRRTGPTVGRELSE